ncbi:hypothetical protein V2W45_1241109, partial [Cenococcum geophilum]
EYKRRLGSKAILGNNKDYNISKADWDTVKNATIIKEVLKGRIKELLNKKAKIMRKYTNKKSKIIQDYKNKKSEIIQDYLNEKSKII